MVSVGGLADTDYSRHPYTQHFARPPTIVGVRSERVNGTLLIMFRKGTSFLLHILVSLQRCNCFRLLFALLTRHTVKIMQRFPSDLNLQLRFRSMFCTKKRIDFFEPVKCVVWCRTFFRGIFPFLWIIRIIYEPFKRWPSFGKSVVLRA